MTTHKHMARIQQAATQVPVLKQLAQVMATLTRILSAEPIQEAPQVFCSRT
jgi:hypothetical protein